MRVSSTSYRHGGAGWEAVPRVLGVWKYICSFCFVPQQQLHLLQPTTVALHGRCLLHPEMRLTKQLAICAHVHCNASIHGGCCKQKHCFTFVCDPVVAMCSYG